jgi:hypothetical protein
VGLVAREKPFAADHRERIALAGAHRIKQFLDLAANLQLAVLVQHLKLNFVRLEGPDRTLAAARKPYASLSDRRIAHRRRKQVQVRLDRVRFVKVELGDTFLAKIPKIGRILANEIGIASFDVGEGE